VELEQVETVYPEPFQRALQTFSRPDSASLGRLATEEYLVVVFLHPRAKSKLSFSICRGNIEMVDAVLDGQFDGGVCFGLRYLPESSGTEGKHAAHMSRLAESSLLHYQLPHFQCRSGWLRATALRAHHRSVLSVRL